MRALTEMSFGAGSASQILESVRLLLAKETSKTKGWPMPNPFFASLALQLRQPAERGKKADVYAIVDAARKESIYSMLSKTDCELSCLFHGQRALELAEVAPYLVKLEPDSPFSDWLLDEGWGNSWGILVSSSTSMRELLRHFQSFLMVYDESGVPLFFRYYDPRVLRVYLPTCNAAELKVIFGPVDHFYAEGANPSFLMRYSLIGSKLEQDSIPLNRSE